MRSPPDTGHARRVRASRALIARQRALTDDFRALVVGFREACDLAHDLARTASELRADADALRCGVAVTHRANAEWGDGRYRRPSRARFCRD